MKPAAATEQSASRRAPPIHDVDDLDVNSKFACSVRYWMWVVRCRRVIKHEAIVIGYPYDIIRTQLIIAMRCQAFSVEIRAIRAAQVAQHQGFSVRHDFRVPCRNGRVGNA